MAKGGGVNGEEMAEAALMKALSKHGSSVNHGKACESGDRNGDHRNNNQ